MKNIKSKPLRIASYTLCTLLILFLLVSIVPIPIRRTVPALEICRFDYKHAVERTVTIRGWWNFSLIAWRQGSNRLITLRNSHRFRGRFVVSGFPETYYGSTRSNQLMSFSSILQSRYAGPVIYPAFARGERSEHGWLVFTEFLFRQTVIEVRHQDWIEHEDGSADAEIRYSRYIVLNAATREEAVEIYANFVPPLFCIDDCKCNFARCMELRP